MDIKIKITYKRMKNMTLRVKGDVVNISAPFFTPKAKINSFVNDNMSFIEKAIKKQKIISEIKTINFEDEVKIMDKTYKIYPISTKNKVTESFIFIKSDSQDIRKDIKKLFVLKQEQLFKDLTLKYFKMMEINNLLPNVKIKDVKSKWGSYNKVKNEIEYASELIFKDVKLYDYIVVHELSHMVEFNHSKNFYNIVARYCPNYKQLRKQLKSIEICQE